MTRMNGLLEMVREMTWCSPRECLRIGGLILRAQADGTLVRVLGEQEGAFVRRALARLGVSTVARNR